MDPRSIGKLGERYAARYLFKQGYTILAANYRTRMGELDIVIGKGKTIAFVEVKTRSPQSLFEPKEAVDFDKRRKMLLSAMSVIKAQELSGYKIRFDVVEVIMDEEGYHDERKAVVNHIENAFSAEGYNAFI